MKGTLTLILALIALVSGWQSNSGDTHLPLHPSSFIEQSTATRQSADYPISPVPFTAVRLTDNFWRPRLETNRSVTIPHIMWQNEVTGRVDNFLKAARKMTGEYKGQRYNDTDIYKILEAASYSLAVQLNPALDKKVDD